MSARWKPIVVGVDASPTAAQAATTGLAIADRAGVPAYLVHATPEAWTVPALPHTLAMRPEELNDAARGAARAAVAAELDTTVSDRVLAGMEVRTGRAATAIRDVVAAHDAGLVVLGGKHHTTLGRWVVGSTAHTLVRSLNVPLLVTAESPWPIGQILVAVDLSDAAGPTINMASRFADLLGASLHVFHAVEPLPIIPETPLRFNDDDVFEQARRYLDGYLWPHVVHPRATTGMGRGVAAEAIATEARARGAGLIVLGSHGKGWVDRILIGSVTERVLSALPASVLVVPVVGHAGGT